jgi:surface polysaccharide O-acyltransferase-like enzyme
VKERRYDIDWLRVIAMLGVFVLHCTRFFCTEDWHVKAAVAEQSEVWALTRGLALWTWLMPLFFLVSGFASRYSLSHRTGGQYLLERVKRLLIPLYTVGILILVVPQAYFERLTHGIISGSFWQWLPTYYRDLPGALVARPRVLDPIFLVPYTFSGHLWFLQMLFIITVVTLPALLFFRSDRGQRAIARLAGWVERPGGIFLFVIPLVIGQVALRWMPKTTDRTWADILWYALFFVIGYIISVDERFTQSIKKHMWLCLILWIVLYVGVGSVFTFVLETGTDPGHGFSAPFVLWQITKTIIDWSAVVFMLGLGAKYLNRTNKFLAYSNEAVLPFYLFHQTVILIVGWYVLQWNISVLAKFALIGLISFPLTLGLYEAFVKRIGFMRLLFGMAPRKKPVATSTSQAEVKGAKP